MSITDFKGYVGQWVNVTWSDRSGNENQEIVEVFQVDFVPMYGPCLITDMGNISIEKILHCEPYRRAAKTAS